MAGYDSEPPSAALPKIPLREALRLAPESRVDSRQYVFSFAIESPAELPADFTGLPADLGALRAGVFLPRDEADWLGRRDYPARVLLLTGQEVVVAAHPSAGEPLLRVPVGRVQSVECGRILLLGWFALSWDGGRKRLCYNTRTRGPIERYMKTFKDQWLPAAPRRQPARLEAFGEPLTPKFEYARSAELLPGEAPLAQFFHPAVCQKRRWGLFRAGRRLAGDLLMATSRRILWITERHAGQYEPYGTVSHSAPLSSIAGASCAGIERKSELHIVFRSGGAWHVPLREIEASEARKFEVAIRRIL